MLSVILSEAETITKVIVDPLADLLGTWSKEINVWSVLLRVLLSVVYGDGNSLRRPDLLPVFVPVDRKISEKPFQSF